MPWRNPRRRRTFILSLPSSGGGEKERLWRVSLMSRPLPVPPYKSRAAIAAGLFGSRILAPLVMAQGAATRRRVPRLPPAKPPHHGFIPGAGQSIRLLAVGESTVCGVGLAHGAETVA